MDIIKKYLSLLTTRERIQGYFLVFLILIIGLIDTLGIASILPFTAVLANPELIQSNQVLNIIYNLSKNYGIKNDVQFIFLLGIFFFFFLIFTLFLRFIIYYAQTKFLAKCEYTVAKILIERYLGQPYLWFSKNHSAEMNKTILSEVSKVVGKGLAPLLNLTSQITVSIAILILLLFVDLKLTLIISFILISFYLLIFNYLKNFVTQLGQKSVKINGKRYKILSEAFNAIKILKLTGIERLYIEQFSNFNKINTKISATISIVGQIPRFLLEGLIFGGMILVVLYQISKNGNFSNAVPILAVYAFAAYRLMPALQLIYNNIIRLRYTNPSLNIIYNDLIELKIPNSNKSKNYIEFKNEFKLKNINFNYSGSSSTILKNINLNLKSNTTIGIIGKTGCGKSTLIDIIIGLIQPETGSIQVDGELIKKKDIRSWQNLIGYVPQKIFLADDTIQSNIAFGVENLKINKDALIEAAKLANIHEFIMNELPQKYETIIGENGARLSGGQQQRIGIARALYRNPKLLVMDEATSALDNQTEKLVMQNIYNLKKKLTTILVAHRLSTLKSCDNIILLEKGEIKKQGSFEFFSQLNN